MLDKHFLDSFLKLNHTSAQMTQGEITSVLRAAGWQAADIESALSLLENNGQNINTPPPPSPNTSTFRPEMDFSSEQLSKLLGVDIVIDPALLREQRGGREVVKETSLKFLFGFVVVCVALGLALGIAVVSAHFLELKLDLPLL